MEEVDLHDVATKRPATRPLGVLFVGSTQEASGATSRARNGPSEDSTRARSEVQPQDSARLPGCKFAPGCRAAARAQGYSDYRGPAGFGGRRDGPLHNSATSRSEPNRGHAAPRRVRASPGRVAGGGRTSARSPGRSWALIELAIAVHPSFSVVSIDRWVNTVLRRSRAVGARCSQWEAPMVASSVCSARANMKVDASTGDLDTELVP